MYKGTMIEELIAAVERAEEQARIRQAARKVEVMEVPAYQLGYDASFATSMQGVA